MQIPAIRGIIDRRILANFRIDPEVMAEVLPAPFQPQLYGGYAIGGICLIRLRQIRPRFFPLPWGPGSENAAHRIAVDWQDGETTGHGVYIPRRDTSSRLTAWAGGLLFPGVQHHARFEVAEANEQFSVTMTSRDQATHVHVSGRTMTGLPDSSVFESLQSASEFFERGSVGYSDTRIAGIYDGLELECRDWHVESLHVDAIRSSFFEDRVRFPAGSVEFDCALLMRNIGHQWLGRANLCCPESVEQKQ